ncbi:cytochrome b6-f complex iron-sulfur subunit [Lyngbya confervoides]|uniref:plastoquinol--plastocyanin reductase n=1 Tax=Lyngbya confervoides BDU141951 TaxID=1574623 RepID=A0ABD4T5I0_9CYAN|nr:cytochrome b6-f complex iron-sulfur subunit [Lyngbya confervoides]MCM1983782.1 cytochrome b6-f complex iron-sulfur subunit [Lyngbya confervoides BDU141951]
MTHSYSLESDYPSPSRRQFLNFLTGTVVAVTAGAALYPMTQFFLPISETSEDGGQLAKDQLGNPIPAGQLLALAPGSRALVAGLEGEPTYLTVTEDGSLDRMGIVDNCTHLGCTFPWNPTDQQFQCPCHGSLYDSRGQVVRGPAPLPLKLTRVEVKEGAIWLYPWTELDPRTGQRPWWS